MSGKHEHKFGEWEGRFVQGHYEKRFCSCGAFQARPIKTKT